MDKVSEREGALLHPTPRLTAEVDRLLAEKRHPLGDEILAVRAAFLGAAPSIHEDTKWNSVSFKTKHNHFATLFLRSTDSLRIVFHTGAKKKAAPSHVLALEDPEGLVEAWPAQDRCLLALGQGEALHRRLGALQAFILAWLQATQGDAPGGPQAVQA